MPRSLMRQRTQRDERAEPRSMYGLLVRVRRGSVPGLGFLSWGREEMREDDDDDVPVLSAQALAALREFVSERSGGGGDGFEEDWGLSQFWYDEGTARVLGDEVGRLVRSAERPNVAVACVACPSLYSELKKRWPHVTAHLFEYDRRFARHGSDFTYYDYNHPEDLPDELQHFFHIVVADPPYLSEECLDKTSQTVRFLSKDAQSCPILLLTGAVQQDRVLKFLGLRPCKFTPSHKHKLGNQFKLYTNYEPPSEDICGWEENEACAVTNR